MGVTTEIKASETKLRERIVLQYRDFQQVMEDPNQRQTDGENNSSPSSPSVNAGDHGLIPSSSRSDESDHDPDILTCTQRSLNSLKEELVSSLTSPESSTSDGSQMWPGVQRKIISSY